jgi:hypothetical protein
MPPPIEAGTPNPEIPACLADIPDRLGMLKNEQLPANFTLIVGHRYIFPLKTEIIEDASRNRTVLQSQNQQNQKWDPDKNKDDKSKGNWVPEKNSERSIQHVAHGEPVGCWLSYCGPP